jgi:hypothetical protein
VRTPSDDSPPEPPPAQERRRVGRLLAALVATRTVLAALAIGGDYPFREGGTIVGDVNLFWRYAGELLGGAAPYTQVPIEYPPGALPAIVVPGLIGGGPLRYRVAFVILCLLLDAAVLAGLLVMRRRTPGRDLAGPWSWVVGIALLGPIALTRLDLLPAVGTVLALERAQVRRWVAAGAWLGFGAAVKVYPGLLLVPALAGAGRGGGRRGALLLAAGAAAGGLGAAALAGGGVLTMARGVLSYHLDRGLQVESVWATPLLVRGGLGRPIAIDFTFRAFHVTAPGAALLEQLATLGALAGLAAGAWLTARAARADLASGLPSGLFVTLLLLLATGSVLSPQYLIWALALGGVALAAGRPALRGPALGLLPVALLTQGVYPILYDKVLELDWPGLHFLVARNLLLVVVALWAAVALWRDTRRSAGVGPAQQVALDQVVPPADQAALHDVGGERTM